ncbi:EF-hand calcium-binding domain-containing protein 14-like isoform X2 [Stylophora pistillata]|uniref:EF-hand calcium-binding domain-containing protein 14-like isoform X2 n=1 Tax=Stylophora pistillata TaxID=50429 RepID=UPI000C049D74|nr:EF-hand calcium-binding domain-containing protein 14-like isoform X2 [Stylophora pistillata]
MNKRKTKMKLSSRRNGTLVPDDDDSDSDLQEFPLPKKRIIKPGKSTYVARRRCGCCRVCASVFLSILLIASVLCVLVLGWFSLRLKRDLDFMRKRLSKVESFDRSTSREYESLNNDLTNKYKALETDREKAVKHDDEQFKSILKQIAYLNLTVDELKKKVKLPESASTLTKDIESLKKGMADTGGDITEIKDKIKQLTDLAGKQQKRMEKLTKNVYNLSVQVAQVMGKPTPKAPANTGTPPLILRMPVNADEKQQDGDESVVKNFTAQISVEVGRVMGILTTVNQTLSYEVSKLRLLMKGLLKEVKKHVVALDDLQTKVTQVLKQNHSSVISRGHLEPDSDMLSEQVSNLSLEVKKLSDYVDQQSKNLAELMLEVLQINTTVSHQQSLGTPKKSVSCNCSTEVGKIREQLSSNKLSIESLKQELQALQSNLDSLSKTTLQPDTTKSDLPEEKQKNHNQSLSDSVTEDTEKDDLEDVGLAAELVKPSPTPRSNANDSASKVNKVAESVTENPTEKSELEAESVKPSPSQSDGSHTASKGDNLKELPVNALPTGHVKSTQNSTQPLNMTASPQISSINATKDRQNSSSGDKIKVEVVKVPTPSKEEALEDSLEDPGSDSA